MNILKHITANVHWQRKAKRRYYSRWKSVAIQTLSSSSETPPPDTQMLQDKINNLEKVLQLSVKTIPFTSPNHYKLFKQIEKRIELLWQPLITKTNDHTSNKSLKTDIKWEFHKRTRQGVSAKLESYIY